MKMRFRLIKPKWAREMSSTPNTIEGEYEESYALNKNLEEGYNVYFFPNHNSKPITGKYLTGKEVDVFSWVFVDMDLKDGIYEDKKSFLEKLNTFPLKPTQVVDSGNGMHVYWKVSDLDRESYIRIQFGLIDALETDTSVWTTMQLMRYPGSLNTKKKDHTILCEQKLYDKEAIYTVADFEDCLAPIKDSQAEKMRTHLNTIDGIVEMAESLEFHDCDELPEVFEHLLLKDPKIRELWYASPGKRSDADWLLANQLYSYKFLKFDEALPIILNTEKARSKKNYRKEYAYRTLHKVYVDRSDFSVPPVSEMLTRVDSRVQGQRINGPHYLDCTKKGWRKGEVLGLIAGSGVGKTTATLDIFYEMLKNNPESTDVYIFFSLEMQDWEVIERWKSLVGDNKDYNNRLYIVSNEDENGYERHINLQQLYSFADGIKRRTGRNIAAMAIDHIGVLDNSIDLAKKPNFGIMGEDVGFGTIRTISLELMCKKMKNLAKQLDTFIILQSQTTKGKAKDGDVELGVDAAYGTAKFEWYMDYILTFWQPLRRVEMETDLRVLAWQYGKIRNKTPDDAVTAYDKRVLKIDLYTGKLSPLAPNEMSNFRELEEKASALREQAEKKKSSEYSNSESLVKLKAIITSQEVVNQ